MSTRTAFLSRLIGVYCMVIALAMGATAQVTVQTVMAAVHDAPVAFLFGMTLTAVGLAMVLSHNVWSGGAVPVIVTIIGWLTLAKGLAFLLLPPPVAVGVILWGQAYQQYFYVDMALVFVLGAYLAFWGFRSR